MKLWILLFAFVAMSKNVDASGGRMNQARMGCLTALEEYYGEHGARSPGANLCKKKAEKHYDDAVKLEDGEQKLALYKDCFIAARSSNTDANGREKCSNCKEKRIVEGDPSSTLRCTPDELKVFDSTIPLSSNVRIISKKDKMGSYNLNRGLLAENIEDAKLAPIATALCPVIEEIKQDPSGTLFSQSFVFLRDHLGTNILTQARIALKKQADLSNLRQSLKGKLTNASEAILKMKDKLLQDFRTDSDGLLRKIHTLMANMKSGSVNYNCPVSH